LQNKETKPNGFDLVLVVCYPLFYLLDQIWINGRHQITLPIPIEPRKSTESLAYFSKMKDHHCQKHIDDKTTSTGVFRERFANLVWATVRLTRGRPKIVGIRSKEEARLFFDPPLFPLLMILLMQLRLLSHLHQPSEPSEPSSPSFTLEAIMPSLEDQLERMPFLGNRNALEVWPYLNMGLIAWALLVIFPRWRYTKYLTILPPLFTAYIYVGGLISLLLFSGLVAFDFTDFTTLDGVIYIFQDPDVMFLGWVHYLVFDLLVGRMMVFDSIERGASLKFHYFVLVPCLALTLMLGPTGWLLYMGIREVFLPEKQAIPEKIKAA
jgi:hypothetical protein